MTIIMDCTDLQQSWHEKKHMLNLKTCYPSCPVQLDTMFVFIILSVYNS